MKIIVFLNLVIILATTSRTSPDYHICECSYKNDLNRSIETSIDTIKIKNKEEAEIKCSNYQTTDDKNESINCKLK